MTFREFAPEWPAAFGAGIGEGGALKPTAALTLPTSLAAYWSLEEASGTRADKLGVSNLTDNNTVTQSAGKIGNAAQFTAATSESLSIADNAALSMGNIACTFAGWLFLDSVGVQRVMLCKGSGNSAATLEYRFSINASNVLTFQVSDGTTLTAVTATVFGALSVSTWYFVEAYHDPVTDTIGIRINGGAAQTAAHTPGIQDNTGNFRMGARPAGDADYWDGRLDEWGVWKKLLSADERAYLYNGGNGRAYAEWGA